MKRHFYLAGAALVLAALGRFILAVAWDRLDLVLLGAGVLIIAAAVAVNRAAIVAWYHNRRGVFALTLAISAVLLVGILVLANIVAWYHPARLDLTKSKRNTLAPETRQLLHRLAADVTLTQFARVRDTQVDALLRSFANGTPRVRAAFVDTDREPLLARQLKIVKNGTVVVEASGKRKKLEAPSEADLATAVLAVTTHEPRAICFTSGHGEHALANEAAAGLSAAKEAIEATNYRAQARSLVEQDVPPDCTVLVLAGPQHELLPIEQDRLVKFVAGGGRLLVLLDPPPAPSLADLLARWGVKPDDDIVIDTSGTGQVLGAGPAVPVAAKYGEHPITRGFEMITLYSLTRSLKPLPDPARRLAATALVETSDKSWGETDLSTTAARFDVDKDIKGPLTLAVASSWPIGPAPAAVTAASPPKSPREARVVVFGDSDFIANALIGRQGNADLLLNALAWLAGDADLISVKPRNEENRRIELSERARRVLFALVIIILPALPLVVGIAVVVRSAK